MSKVQLILTNADGVKEAAKEQYSVIVVYVTREEVDRGTIGDVVDRLMAISDDPKLCKMYMGKLLMSFDGYGNDPRELQEIPEVRRFLAAIHAQWPYWFYFLEPEAMVRTIALSLVDIKRMTGVLEDDTIGFEPDAKQMAVFLEQCVTASANIANYGHANPEAYKTQILTVMKGLAPGLKLDGL